MANAFTAALLAEDYLNGSKTMAHTSVYHHAPDAQPEGLPLIVEGQHGKGEWVICATIMNEEGSLEKDLNLLESSVNELMKKNMDGLVDMRGIGVQVGVWKGDVFMS